MELTTMRCNPKRASFFPSTMIHPLTLRHGLRVAIPNGLLSSLQRQSMCIRIRSIIVAIPNGLLSSLQRFAKVFVGGELARLQSQTGFFLPFNFRFIGSFNGPLPVAIPNGLLSSLQQKERLRLLYFFEELQSQTGFFLPFNLANAGGAVSTYGVAIPNGLLSSLQRQLGSTTSSVSS